jgi:hypothetical protein
MPLPSWRCFLVSSTLLLVQSIPIRGLTY